MTNASMIPNSISKSGADPNCVYAQKCPTPRRPIVLTYASRAFAWLERVSCHKALMCLLAMTTVMATRIVLLPWIPIPKPYIADEFSYLLGAETFAAGRLTNPMHPMWEHFETFHQLMHPTYMSMYPPGQAVFLAVGWKLLGDPWFGVWISFGLFAACLCWMLQNWVPPIYAVLGTIITLARVSPLGYWMNSYWGGAVAAIGGCLVLGALPRLAREDVKSKDVVVAAIGLFILTNTRPFEGLLVSVAAFVALLFWRKRQRRSLTILFSPRYLILFMLVCGAGGLLDGYYNYRVTGNPLLMPYTVYYREYRNVPPLIIFPERAAPVYRHADLERVWGHDVQSYRNVRSNFIGNLKSLRDTASFYGSPLILFPVAIAIILSASYRLWTATAIYFVVWCGQLIEVAKFPHYIAASVGLLPLLAIYGFRLLRVIGRDYGPVLVLTLVALVCFLGKGASELGQVWQARGADFISPRMIGTREAMRQGGRHLIVVRYSEHHVDNDEVVYNAADIDASPIVWARDMGEAKNRELINYYGGSRKVWLYEPDIDPTKLIPYESVSQ
jgi:hypothetical protein